MFSYACMWKHVLYMLNYSCIRMKKKAYAFHFLLQIAITGKGFHKASVLATGLIMKNILRIGKVNVIGDVILFLGKLCEPILCAFRLSDVGHAQVQICTEQDIISTDLCTGENFNLILFIEVLGLSNFIPIAKT